MRRVTRDSMPGISLSASDAGETELAIGLEEAAPAQPATPCRLCGGLTTYAFNAELIGKHNVRYFVCTSCGSLETEPPFWLEESYLSNLGDLDCGSAQRNLHNFAASYAM